MKSPSIIQLQRSPGMASIFVILQDATLVRESLYDNAVTCLVTLQWHIQTLSKGGGGGEVGAEAEPLH